MLDDLLAEYRKTLLIINEALRRADKEGDKLSKSGLSASASNCRYIIYWLETGYPPRSSEDVSRLSYEQREVPMDPHLIAKQWIAEAQANNPSEAMCNFLDDILAGAGVTDREKEALLKVRGLGWSFQDTADWMKVSRGTVQTMIERAEVKIRVVVKKKPGSKTVEPELQKEVQRVMFV